MMRLFARKKTDPVETYDPSLYKPVIRVSICTGEKVAGFRAADGRVMEIMLIRSEKDLEEFRRTYNIQGKIDTVY